MLNGLTRSDESDVDLLFMPRPAEGARPVEWDTDLRIQVPPAAGKEEFWFIQPVGCDVWRGEL